MKYTSRREFMDQLFALFPNQETRSAIKEILSGRWDPTKLPPRDVFIEDFRLVDYFFRNKETLREEALGRCIFVCRDSKFHVSAYGVDVQYLEFKAHLFGNNHTISYFRYDIHDEETREFLQRVTSHHSQHIKGSEFFESQFADARVDGYMVSAVKYGYDLQSYAELMRNRIVGDLETANSVSLFL